MLLNFVLLVFTEDLLSNQSIPNIEVEQARARGRR